jgi:hypothetical protein
MGKKIINLFQEMGRLTKNHIKLVWICKQYRRRKSNGIL